MKLRAERLFVEINVNTIYRCFLADSSRGTRHLPVRVQKEQERKHYVNAFSSCGAGLQFVCRSRMGGGGTDRKSKADAPRLTRHLSGRLIGSSLCGFPRHIWAVDDF